MAESGPCRRRGIGALGQWVQEMRWLAERRWGLYISESACETRPSKNTNGMHRLRQFCDRFAMFTNPT